VIVGGEAAVLSDYETGMAKIHLFQADRQKAAFFFKQWGLGADGIKRNKRQTENA
jgi:protein gp37